MAITLTGSKSNGTVASVGTYTVTTTAAVFSSGDYSVSRYAVLFTSAGVFKGIARVRSYSSTTVLNLMTAFYDPVDGSTVTQVVGDLVHVSVNLSEVTVSGAGWTYTASGAVATDAVYFGTSPSQTSLVLHDVGRTILSTWAGSAAVGFFQFRGGVCVFGTPAEPTSNDVFQPVTLSISSALASGAFVAVSAESSLPSVVFYGGGIGEMTAGSTDRRPLVFNTNPKTFVGVSANLPMVQGSTASARHVLRNCSFTQLNAGASILMWGSGVIDGGFIRSSQAYTTYAVFRVASAGTYAYGASAGQRMVVSDANASLPATFTSSVFTYTVNFTNFVGVPRTAYATFSPTPNNSATNNFYYSDTFTGVVSGSTVQVRLDSDSSLVDSTLGSGTTWAPTVWRDSYTGATQNSGFPRGPWTYGIKRYGRAAVAGAIAASTYDLGAAGTADNVAFGGAVVQAEDAAVTLSESAALALATIDTLDDLYDALIAWGCASVANAAYPSLGAYPCTSGGGVIDLGDQDLIIDGTAGSAISVNTGTGTITIKSADVAAGTKHTSLTTTGTVSTSNGGAISALYTDATGTHVTIAAASLVSGSRVQLYNVTDSTEIYNGVLASTGLTYATTWAADKTIRLRTEHEDYLPLEATGVLTSAGLTFLSVQTADAVYAANGIDGSTCTEFTADGANVQIDLDDPDGVTDVQRLYAWLQYYQTTEEGVASDFFGAMTAADTANYRIDADLVDLRLDNVSATPVIIAGGYLYRSDNATVIATGSGSIQMDPGRAYVAPGTATAANVWAYATRTLTVDPGAAAHATTQAAVAAVPAAVRTELATELARVDVATSTRLAAADYVVPPTAASNADTLLGRNLAGSADGGRTVRDALRASRNKTAISGSTLTVYEEDDTTPAWTASVSTEARDALQSIDPA